MREWGGACSLYLTYILEAPLEAGKVCLTFPTILVDVLLTQVYVGEVSGGGACSLCLTYILEAPLEEGKVRLTFPAILVGLLFAQVYVGEVDGGGACSLSLTYILEAPLEEGKVRLTFPTTLAPRYHIFVLTLSQNYKYSGEIVYSTLQRRKVLEWFSSRFIFF